MKPDPVICTQYLDCWEFKLKSSEGHWSLVSFQKKGDKFISKREIMTDDGVDAENKPDDDENNPLMFVINTSRNMRVKVETIFRWWTISLSFFYPGWYDEWSKGGQCGGRGSCSVRIGA